MIERSTVIRRKSLESATTAEPRHFVAMTPPVAGAVFAGTLAFMLLFPFVRLSLDGYGYSPHR
jgi:hypothetical protein